MRSCAINSQQHVESVYGSQAAVPDHIKQGVTSKHDVVVVAYVTLLLQTTCWPTHWSSDASGRKGSLGRESRVVLEFLVRRRKTVCANTKRPLRNR